MLPLILILEYFIRAADLLECLHGFLVPACLVGVVLLSHFVIIELDGFAFCIWLDSECFVEIVLLVVLEIRTEGTETPGLVVEKSGCSNDMSSLSRGDQEIKLALLDKRVDTGIACPCGRRKRELYHQTV